MAQEALQRIGALYAIGAEIRGQLPDVRQATRQARAGLLLLEDLHTLVAGHLAPSLAVRIGQGDRLCLGCWR